MDRNEFGRLVLQELRKTDRILVEDAYLDEINPEYPLVVLLCDESQPVCLFGYRWPLEPEWSADPLQDPYFPAMLTAVNLRETLIGGSGLPRDCDPDGITWF